MGGVAFMTYSGVDSAPYFFLGYAHTPEQSWVAKLYRDLCTEVLERTVLPTTAQVGFMDESGIPLGGVWREEVAGALASCKVFVPLYSPRYFTREECGREWHAFAQRILDHKARLPGNPTAIVPALWTPVDFAEMPEVARRIQMNHESLTPDYVQEGFYTLIKNSYYAESYTTAVQQLAKHIIQAAETSQLRPCSIRDFGSPRNAFDEPNRERPADRRLTVVVAAPTLDRLPAGRSSSYYGASANDWNPYHPSSRQTIGEYTAEVARMHSYEPTLLSFDDGYDVLREADASSGLGVLLVDAWVGADESLARKLRGFDALDLEWIGTMVPWNQDDPETKRNADDLKRDLFSLLPKRLSDVRVPSPLGTARIPTLEQFRLRLLDVIDATLFRYLNVAPAHPPAGSIPPRPRLSGPPDYGDDPQGRPDLGGGSHD
jgi:FxsC-like protein